MFPIIMEKRYDEISTNILRLLIKFSEHIMSIKESINKLLMNNKFNKNTDFLNFVKHFCYILNNVTLVRKKSGELNPPDFRY